MALTSITFNVGRDTSGVRTFAVRSSKDSYAANLLASISPINPEISIKSGNVFYITKDTAISTIKGNTITINTATFKNLITPVTFRIYGWNAEDSTGTFSIDSVAVKGDGGLIENTQNYMDYSYCSVMFTKGQKARMRAAIESSTAERNKLWSASNLVATGTDQTYAVCKPLPDFYASRTQLCEGGTVTFTKNVLRGTETSLKWEFEGGSPSTSTSSVQVVTYSTAGLYNVKLIGTNASGKDSVLKNDYIRVELLTADYTGLKSESFETAPPDFLWYWHVFNLDKNAYTWDLYSAANGGSSGTKSIVMEAFGNYKNDVDEIVTPSFNLKNVTAISMSFKVAAASRASDAIDINDVLKIYYSTGCSSTWIPASGGTFTGSGTAAAKLINNGYFGTAFTPNAGSVWTTKTVTIPTPGSTAAGNVRFKFEYTTGEESNNIYIDDINISGTVGIEENTMSANSMFIYPNPSNSLTNIAYHLNKRANTRLEVFDVVGKKVYEENQGYQNEGDYVVSLSKESNGLSNGVYFIKLTVDKVSATQKLIITE